MAVAALAAVLVTAAACDPVEPSGGISGEVRFAREVPLPEGAVVTVKLLDTSLADAPSVELARDTIADARKLPVKFNIDYDSSQIADGREYSLSADVRHDGDLLYINDTVHTVLTRGALRNSDVVVISTNPLDTCDEPLPGIIHGAGTNEDLPRDAVLLVRLIDVSDPALPLPVTNTIQEDLGGFPIEFELPHEFVQINRNHRYELEAVILVDGVILYHNSRPDWRKTVLPHCPNEDLLIVNSVFPISEVPLE